MLAHALCKIWPYNQDFAFTLIHADAPLTAVFLDKFDK
jgi:hypothetical protein